MTKNLDTKPHATLAERKEQLMQWLKEHKKQLAFTGLTIGGLLLLVLVPKDVQSLQNLEDALKLFKTGSSVKGAEDGLKVVAEEYVVEGEDDVKDTISFLIEVRKHIRNLPNGYQASPSKIESAEKNGFILKDGQTWVEEYTKGGCAA